MISQTTGDKILQIALNKFSDKFNTEKLDGKFAPFQTKRFFERYDLLIHQPNTNKQI